MDRLDITEAARILDQDHYDLKDVKERVLEFLAVRKLNPEGKALSSVSWVPPVLARPAWECP